MGCWLFRGETLIFKESVERPALFLCGLFGGGDGLRNGLEQMMCFKPVDFDEFECFQRILKRILD